MNSSWFCKKRTENIESIALKNSQSLCKTIIIIYFVTCAQIYFACSRAKKKKEIMQKKNENKQCI